MKISLQDKLINQITSYIQILPANYKLPSERQLAETYQVSRNTVRLALLNLEETGLVRRIHGKGTFVSRINLESDIESSYKFDQQMRLLGKVLSTKIINFKKREANEFFAEKLDLKIGEMMFQIDRLRLADNEPMMCDRSFLPFKLFKELTKEMLENKSMYDVFSSKFNQKVNYADEYFSASSIGNCDSKIMKLPQGTSCLRLKRKAYNLDNQIIEFTLSVARSDEFAYHVRHQIQE